MRTIKISIIAFMLVVSTIVGAQDIHFSQFYNSPLTLNPAYTGAFNGDYRFAGIYRSQWGNLSLFSTPDLSFDMPLPLKLGNDKLAVGANIYSDNQGKSQSSSAAIFTQTNIMLSTAYHKILDADQKHSLSIGVQFGIVQKALNSNQLTFGSQFDGLTINQNNASGETFSNKSLFAFNTHLGVAYAFKVNNRLTTRTGLALFNLIQPKETYLTNSNGGNIGMRFSLNLGADYEISSKFSLHPSVLYLKQRASNDFNIGTALGYNISALAKADARLFGGLWFRTQDSDLIPMVGLAYKTWKFGFSYDTNLATINNFSGKNAKAFEVSLIYIMKFVSPVKDVTLPCLRF